MEAPTAPTPLKKRDYELMKQAMINEHNAPELLPYQQQLVDRIKRKIAEQEDVLEAMSKQAGQELPRIVLEWELNRVRYLLRRYYRSRIRKLQQHAAYVLDRSEYTSRLSTEELTFVKDYFLMSAHYLNETVLKHLPDMFQSVARQQSNSNKDMVAPFKLKRPVLFRVLERNSGFEANESGDERVDMEVNDRIMMPYNLIQQLLMDGAIELM